MEVCDSREEGGGGGGGNKRVEGGVVKGKRE